ncbi:hypothetical protein [Clostridium beijerinckii]|uniref:hypothetical protein n=1 Tax=Clostridium beijerinckii TaxID=1520 RepID=UPI0013612D47|nr:hypothetical protein [Clostridium beijerinckii]MZK49887.1 hypothetical protein [Clostridium beijerinckii]MZK57846.1 hypothetical protein [Clostridium beijerinckii]MZK68057.1 hypothetical protein [Clostridium beijerinckii]MZK73555.1 hypothetical protein [Clostridium beijerinckii]MZK83137.1 hypothetical protein [Clostridium beijerinckii]
MNEEMEILKTILDYINKLEIEIEKTAYLFISGKLDDGNKNIPLIIDGIQWVIDAINMIKYNNERIVQTEKINPKLTQLLDGYENGDYILTGDTFLYEISPVIKEWNEILTLYANK